MAENWRELLDPGSWLAVKPQLDPDALSLSLDHEAPAGEIKLRLAVGFVVLAFSAALIYFVADDDGIVTLVGCGFGLFALLNIIYGAIRSRFSMNLSITPSEVVMRSTRLFGRNDWREPLPNYRGVLLREHHTREQTVGNIESTASFHVVELAHSDPRKTVALFVQQGGKPPRETQQKFALRFRLPALLPD